MKILHTGDLHIGANRRFPNYLERNSACCNEILQLCNDHNVDMLVLCGDLFDNTNPTLEEKRLLSNLLSSCPVPVALTYGNHEYFGPAHTDTSLEWLISLTNKTPTIRMWNRPTVEKWRGAWWIVIPSGKWNTPEFYLIATALLRKIPKDAPEPIIGIAHEFFAGSVTDTGYQGKDDRCRMPKLARINYWALGDVHVSQQVTKSAWYSGSPIQIKFGDKTPKGVLITEIGSRPRFIEIKTPARLIEIKGIPKEWPSNAYIKLHCDARNLPPKLPDSVVAVSQTATPTDAEEIRELHGLAGSNYILKGMKSYLKKRGLGPASLKRAMSFTRRLVKTHVGIA